MGFKRRLYVCCDIACNACVEVTLDDAQPLVCTRHAEQFGVCAELADASVFQHEDAICMHD